MCARAGLFDCVASRLESYQSINHQSINHRKNTVLHTWLVGITRRNGQHDIGDDQLGSLVKDVTPRHVGGHVLDLEAYDCEARVLEIGVDLLLDHDDTRRTESEQEGWYRIDMDRNASIMWRCATDRH